MNLLPIRQVFDAATLAFRPAARLVRDLYIAAENPHAFDMLMLQAKSHKMHFGQMGMMQLGALDRLLAQSDTPRAALCRANLHGYLFASGTWYNHLITMGAATREREISLYLFSGYMQLWKSGQTDALDQCMNANKNADPEHESIARTAYTAFTSALQAKDSDAYKDICANIDNALANLSRNFERSRDHLNSNNGGASKRMADIFMRECIDRGFLKQDASFVPARKKMMASVI